MRGALAHGPGHCPPDLFAGPVDRILLGLKAHANTISHARHVAMEDTFPRTRVALGAENFHELAGHYLERGQALHLPFTQIGRAFPEILDGLACDLARIEWAWFEVHGATDAIAFDLDAITGLTAEQVASSRVVRHPAARMASVDHPGIVFDGVPLNGGHALITRPSLNVCVTAVGDGVAQLFILLERPLLLGEMLETDAAATTQLVTSGTLMLAPETDT